MAFSKRSKFVRTEKVRIYPRSGQEAIFNSTLFACQKLYNGALEERRDAYKRYVLAGKPKDFIWPTFASQKADYISVRPEIAWLADTYSETLIEALTRLDNAMNAFIARVAKGQKPGYPRFKNIYRYDTFCYPHGNRVVKVFDKTLKLEKKLGFIKYRKSGRDLPEKFGQVKITRKNGKWYACFEHIITPKESKHILERETVVGIDLGVKNYAVTSDDTFIANPLFDRSSTIEQHQKNLARKKNKKSNRRKKALRVLQIAYEKVANRRRDYAHKISHLIVNKNFDVIGLEELQILNMTKSAKGTIEKPGKNVAQKSGLTRSLLDLGTSQLRGMILYKAEEAGKDVMLIDPKFTSQRCFKCKKVSAENRKSQSEFLCIFCGHRDHADRNAAKNIRYEAWLRLVKHQKMFADCVAKSS